MSKSFIAISLALLLLSFGCVSTQPSQEKSSMIVWKTDQAKYADMGFISDSRDLISVEIYGVGSALMRLKIDSDNICMSQFQCMSKRAFNAQQLSSHYPLDILTHIFRSQKIFAATGVKIQDNGFTQRVKKQGAYDIRYSVTKQETLFEDRLNNIVIKIKNID